jgi:DNA-directed RNA polymerase subunit RPC12/RpoP
MKIKNRHTYTYRCDSCGLEESIGDINTPWHKYRIACNTLFLNWAFSYLTVHLCPDCHGRSLLTARVTDNDDALRKRYVEFLMKEAST